MLRIGSTILFLSCLLHTTILAQSSSILADGKWVKMGFSEPGVYKITHNQLNEMGFVPAEIDPRNIRIYGNPGGMLPQANENDRPVDLQENAILVNGESDGIFNAEDYILFYVDEIDRVTLDENDGFQVTKNLYSDQNFYFITVAETQGKRITNTPNLGSNHPEVNWYNRIIFHENDIINLLTSGREWLGEQFTTQNVRNFQHNLPNIAPDQEVKMSLSVLAQSFGSSSMGVEVNSTNVGELSFNAIPNTQYGIKGNIRSSTFNITTNDLSSAQSLDLNLIYDQNGATNAIAYLNSYLIDVPTRLAYNGNPIHIRNRGLAQNISTFRISGATSQLMVWNVTDPVSILSQGFELSGSTMAFGAFTDNPGTYFLFDPSELPGPKVFEQVGNQDLHGEPTPDFIIVTHPDFLSQAKRLADFRSMHDGLSVLVTTVNEVYNEFSSGRQDVTAIRDFIRSKYLQDNRLKYVLLFGKGSYDFKSRIEENTNFVPTYESRNSVHPLLTYSSDDFFGFMDEDEGQWIESRAGDHLLDVGIGRIPATNVDQAEKAVDKIILYQTNQNTFGNWRSKLLFVADDGDNNRHQKDADSLSTLIDTTFAAYNIQKLYLDAFEQVRLPNGEVSPDATEALIEGVNDGALIVNFTGHGSEFGWMQEQVLTFDMIDQWNNTYNLPFLVTATCEFGRNDDPGIFSGAEKILFKNVGGAIALVTTARPVFASTNYDLNLALYGSILEQENGQYQRLGDIIRFTKNNSLRGSLNRNFILLGDPSMRLSYPDKAIELTEINGNIPSENDTIRALQQVLVKGRIMQNNAIDPSFSGTLDFVLFDKTTSKQTLGTDGDKFPYEERDRQLFRGTASVLNGEFEVAFIVPKNIDYSFGTGKMNFYAVDPSNGTDALGTAIDFVIGGTADNVTEDEIPPEIRLFLNDTTETIQQSYGPQVTFIAKLFDESGINISDQGIGQNLSLTLNDSITFNLNQHYNAEMDSYQKGILSFEIDDLPAGTNTVELKAWDIHGNSESVLQDFTVDGNTPNITVINNTPNPFKDETLFNIEHLLEGENLEVAIQILNLKGEPVTAIFKEFLSASEVLSIPWSGTNNNDQPLDKGVYIYTIKIHSKTSGKSGIKRQKLLISN